MLAYELRVYNATSKAIVTRLGCHQVPFRVKQRDCVYDLICLPMTGLDLILGLDWLSKNRVMLDYFERSLQFISEGSEGPVMAKGYYLNSVIINSNGCECQGVMLLAANVLGKKQSLDRIPIVNEFPEVFSFDIPEFPLSREIEFAIELVLGAGPISISPYRMPPLELTELKSQLEELMSKNFI
ncbi:uncharacterized protein LOC107466464 [Arachis duranensis]|uniref:Uncharacterized protein LOC107466464 n=1 Tax=Arachis duranensis TaxID=130453 RepID=A0A6P4C2F5_ARADU|nr:uncharacterized protein LOC107466464 [Arachis duranensis]